MPTFVTKAEFDAFKKNGTYTPLSGWQVGPVTPGMFAIFAYPQSVGFIPYGIASVGTAPTNEIVIECRKNGSTFLTITIPAGMTENVGVSVPQVEADLDWQDRISLYVVSGNGADLAVTLLVSGFGGTS